MIFEILIGVFYIRYLYKRMPIETLDDIPGVKVTEAKYNIKQNPHLKKKRFKTKITVSMNVKESARYIQKEIGEIRAAEILDEM